MPRIDNVWAVPCPKCFAPTNSACVHMGTGRDLFGRRTHLERARKVREMATISATTGTITAGYLTTGNQVVWNNWTSTTTTINATVWDAWIQMNQVATTTAVALTNAAQTMARELTEQQLRDRAQRQRETESRMARQLELDRTRRELVRQAQARAEQLLRSVVPPEDHFGDYLQVRAPSGRIYRIMLGDSIHGNVNEVDEHGCVLENWCGAPIQRVSRQNLPEGAPRVIPSADAHLGQYLALKYNEDQFRGVANGSYRRDCQRVNTLVAA